MNFLDELIKSATDAKADGKEPISAAAELLRATENAPDLAELETQLVERFSELYAEGEYDPNDGAVLEALADATDAVRTVAAEQQQARAELDEHVNNLAARVNGQPDEGEGEQPEPAADGEAEAEAEQSAGDPGEGEQSPEPPAAPTEPAATETPPAAPAPAPEATTPAEPAREPVAASASSNAPARRPMPSVRQINAQRRPQAVRASATGNAHGPRRRYSITAAADVPRVPSGSALSMSELATATNNRFQAMPIGQPGVGRMRNGIALIKRETDPDLTLTGRSVEEDAAKIDTIADESRLPGGSLASAVAQTTHQALTAASSGPAGLFTNNDIWCVPSETDYTLCPPLATREGLLDLPTMAVTRAGVRYPVWPQFPDQLPPENWRGRNHMYPPAPEEGWTAENSTGLADPNFFRAPDGGGYPKECIEGPCPTWVEKRMNLSYLCVAGDILRDHSWPALTERFISDVLVQHAHYMDSLYIQEIVNNSDQLAPYNVSERVAGPPTTFANGSLSSGLLDHLLLLVAWFRNRYKMSRSATLEGFAPDWFRDMIKLDLEKKSNRPYGSVSNAEVDAILAAAGARVQWVYNHQPLGDGEQPGNVSGMIMPPAGWPNSVELVLYPAGSWVLGEDDIITLDAIYDSTQLRENRYTQLFTESGWLLLNRCNRSFRITLNNICANGAIGPNRDICPPSSAPEPEPEPTPEAQQQVQASTRSSKKQ